MKQKIIILIAAISAVVIGGAGFYYWHYTGERRTTSHESQPLYHCPMHPAYTSDKPGSCPICGMDLVPIEEEKRGKDGGVTISMERQQLIGVKIDTIKKSPAIMKIRTAATSAFNPDLAIAQREYIEAKKIGEASLVEAAKERLILLGMNEEEIKQLKGVQKGLYLPSKDSWIYPVVYENELPYLKTGQKVAITFNDGKKAEGIVRSIDSVIDPMTRTARLHVELKEKIRPSAFGAANIEIDLGERLLLPKSAVMNTGERSIAFMVHEETHFMSMEVKLGAELADDYVLEEGLSEGDAVVTSATFLIDSESRLKSAIGKASNGGGEHKH